MWGYGNVGGLGYGLGFGFGWFMMLVFLGLIIWAVFALIKGFSNQDGHRNGHHGKREHMTNNALDILKERYAKGEISKEEFDKMKQDLQ
jgi:putative membrane protein